ncbi:endothelin-converting enzyme 2-like [Dermacentor andersoni]|uniref:endothelin-converting enzyme 2-like n=1 Tax=Dermacentor andersoni TaxID=34620 RepID=UPI003B3B3089
MGEVRKEGSRSSFDGKISEHFRPVTSTGNPSPVGGRAKDPPPRRMSSRPPISTDNAANLGSYEGAKTAAVSSAGRPTPAKTNPASPSMPAANKGVASAEGFDTKRKYIPKGGFSEGNHAASTPSEARGLGVRLRHVLANLRVSSEEGRPMRLALIVALVIGVVCVLLVLVMPWALAESSWSSRANTSDGPRICDTADCLNHVYEIGLNRTSYRDPCDDFGRFVCSAWIHRLADTSKSLSGEQVTTKGLLGLTKVYSANASKNVLEDGHLSNRPWQLMALCLDARPDDQAGLRALKELISTGELAFLSPQRYIGHDSYARLVQHLVVLSGKWLIPLWFRIEMLPIREIENSKIFVISPEPVVLSSRRLHKTETASESSYAEYVELHLQAIYDDGKAVPADYVRFLRHSSATVQATVLNTLSEAIGMAFKRDTIVRGRLTELSKFLPNRNATDWVEALRAVYNGAGWHGVPVSGGDLMHATSLVHLNAMAALMGNVTALELLYHTSWWFVQQIGSLTSNTIFNSFATRHKSFGETIQKVMCAYQVVLTYNVLIEVLHRDSWSKPQRDAARKVFHTVSSVALRKLRNFTHFNGSQSKTMVSAIDGIDTVIWPDQRQSDKVENLYGDAVNNTFGFFGHWLTSRMQWQRAIVNWASRSFVSQIYLVDITALCRFNPALLRIAVAIASLDSPFFYHHGTPAMLYGGLGFLYARCLFFAFDVVAQIADVTKRNMPVADDSSHLENAVHCQRQGVDRETLYPFLPALEVAYAAYIKALNGSEDARLKGMEQYSGEQVFFLTMCHTLCEVDGRGSAWSPACNAAAREFEPFTKAFGCAGGSSMNPKEKCHFF